MTRAYHGKMLERSGESVTSAILLGCLILALIFVGAGASGTADYFCRIYKRKTEYSGRTDGFSVRYFVNFFVCLAVLCGIKLKSESGKFLMIVICISGFVVSGFEHCIANMGNFYSAFCMVPGLSVGAMLQKHGDRNTGKI
mgnify:CR=1 FL=1